MSSVKCGCELQNMTSLVRSAVVRSNAIWPFTLLNRLPYRLALWCIVRRSTKFSEIRSIYLRHGLTEANWQPGLSDIDLTVVIDGNLGPDKEYAFLTSFAAAYLKLKAWFPMLGEIDILNERCCTAWTRFSMRGYEVRNWRLLHGAHTVNSLHPGGQETLASDAFALALTVFEHFFLQRYHAGRSFSWVDRRSLVRIARKVLKYGQGPGMESGRLSTHLDASMRPEEVLWALLLHLDRRADELAPTQGKASDDVAQCENLDDETLEIEYRISTFSHLQRHRNEIDSVVLSYGRPFIILRSGLTRTSALNCLAALHDAFSDAAHCPLILTRRLFEYYVTRYLPQGYLELREHRHILFGKDYAHMLAPPSSLMVGTSLLAQAVNVMLRPWSLAVVDGRTPRTQFAREARNSLLLKLFLDFGIVDSYEVCMQMCQRHYPDLCAEIDLLAAQSAADEKDAREAQGKLAHSILRRIAVEVNAKLESWADEEAPGPQPKVAALTETGFAR